MRVMSVFFFFFKQKTAYEISTRDWSSDVCSSDLLVVVHLPIPVHIAEHRPAHHSQFLQALAHHQPPLFVLQDQRIGRLRIPPTYHPAPHKQIQVPIPVHVSQRQRPHPEALSKHTFPVHLRL